MSTSDTTAQRWWIATACTVLLALCLHAKIAVAEVTAGLEFAAPFLRDHFFNTVAVLDDGSFAFAGTIVVPNSQDPNGGGIAQAEVQAYKANGASAGRRFAPQPPAGVGGVGSLGSRYFASWQYALPESTQAGLLNATGRLIEGPVSWPDSNVDDFSQLYRYGPNPRHDFLPVFIQPEPRGPRPGPTTSMVTVQAYSAAAQPLGRAVVAASFLLDGTAIDGQGHFVLVGGKCPPEAQTPADCARGLQVFRSSGEPLTPLLTAAVPPYLEPDGSDNSQISVAVDAEGEILLLWEADVFSSEIHVMARLFDPQGSPISDEWMLFATEPNSIRFGPLLGLTQGRFLFSWESFQGSATTIHVSELFRGKLSPGVAVTTRQQLTPDGHILAINDAGEGILGWTTIDEQGNFTGHARHITVQDTISTTLMDGVHDSSGAVCR